MAKKGFEIDRMGNMGIIAGEVKTCNEHDDGNITVTVDIAVWNKDTKAEETKTLRLTFHDGAEDWQKNATNARKMKVGVGSFIIAYVKYADEKRDSGFVNRFVYPGRNLKVKYKYGEKDRETIIVSGRVYLTEGTTKAGKKWVKASLMDRSHDNKRPDGKCEYMDVFIDSKLHDRATRVFTREKGQEIDGIFRCWSEKEDSRMDAEANTHVTYTYNADRFYTIREA